MAGCGGGWLWWTMASASVAGPCEVWGLGMRRSLSPGSAFSASSLAPEWKGHEQRRLVHGWAA